MSSIIFGANGGVGAALTSQLVDRDGAQNVVAISRSGDAPAGATAVTIKTYDDDNLAAISKDLSSRGGVDLCVCAIGILSNDDGLKPERSLKQQSRDTFQTVFEANVIVPALVAKHVLPLMPKSGRCVFAALSARVGSISDNQLGGWHAYRSSKAALNMLIKNYAIELARINPEAIVIGLHPGTVATDLSAPFQANVPEGQLFSPEQSAGYLLNVIDVLTPDASGKVFDWAGRVVPP